jgi:hypothetical protein
MMIKYLFIINFELHEKVVYILIYTILSNRVVILDKTFLIK